MATKEEILASASQRKLQGASPVADTMHWIGEAGDDAKRLANMAARKIAMANQGMEQDASRWDTMNSPSAMAQYQGPTAPVTVGGMARNMMDPAHMPMRPAASVGEAVQMAGALLPGEGGMAGHSAVEKWVQGGGTPRNRAKMSQQEQTQAWLEANNWAGKKMEDARARGIDPTSQEHMDLINHILQTKDAYQGEQRPIGDAAIAAGRKAVDEAAGALPIETLRKIIANHGVDVTHMNREQLLDWMRR